MERTKKYLQMILGNKTGVDKEVAGISYLKYDDKNVISIATRDLKKFEKHLETRKIPVQKNNLINKILQDERKEITLEYTEFGKREDEEKMNFN